MEKEEMLKKEEILGSVENAIKSMYQMILVINEEPSIICVADHNPELSNLSADGSFLSFCEELIVNVHPADREGVRKFVDPDRYPGELKKKVYVSHACRIRHANSRYYWSELTFCNSAAEDSTEGHAFLFLIRDIHERKRKELREETEQRAALKDLQDRYDQLFEENMKDEQTGCYNRKGMRYYTDIVLDEARNTGKHLFICVADLNGLKYLNDTYGHAAGDEAIAAVSAELLAAAPKGSRIVRTGGDEFLLMAALSPDSKEPEEMNEKIDRGLEEYNQAHPHPYTIGASYGWVLLPVKEGMTDIDEYVGIADAKMYEMKMQRDEHRRV